MCGEWNFSKEKGCGKYHPLERKLSSERGGSFIADILKPRFLRNEEVPWFVGDDGKIYNELVELEKANERYRKARILGKQHSHRYLEQNPKRLSEERFNCF